MDEYFEALFKDRQNAKLRVQIHRNARKKGICIFPQPIPESAVAKFNEKYNVGVFYKYKNQN